jgi:hypothetical protein
MIGNNGKMRYVLHIGTNKTGTSTLQEYLGTHRAELLLRGIWYPTIGSFPHAHHDLAYAIKKGDFASYGISPDVVSESTAPLGTRTILISSEAFHTIRDIESIAAMFPPDKTQVVLYLREHVSYLASWYREAVQARDVTCSFYDFAQIFGYSLMDLVGRWEAVYGGNLHVRHYERDKLANNDIVTDFFATAFDGPPPVIREFDDRNPSISGNLLFLKLLLNHLLTPQQNAAIVYELSTLATLDKRFGGKMFVSERDAKRLAHRHRQDRKDLKEHYRIVLTPPRDGIEGNKSPDLTILREDIAYLLDASKARQFAFHDIFFKCRDMLSPAISEAAA